VVALDTLVNPGDTGYFRLTYNTKDDFGPTVRSFQVYTNHPDLSEITYVYHSTVGQWANGLKPAPTSLFFLPAHKTKKVTIPNTAYDEIRLAIEHQHDATYTVTLVKDKAGRGKALELEVTPRPDLKKGTYESSLTLRIEKEDDTKPTLLTVPIKIVRY
jgi:hypothetical protein